MKTHLQKTTVLIYFLLLFFLSAILILPQQRPQKSKPNQEVQPRETTQPRKTSEPVQQNKVDQSQKVIQSQPSAKIENKNPRPQELKKQVVNDEIYKSPIIKQPIRGKPRVTPVEVKHDLPVHKQKEENDNYNSDDEAVDYIITVDGYYHYPAKPVRPYQPKFPLPKPHNPPKQILSLKEEGIQDYYDGNYDDALDELTEAFKLDTLDFELLYWRGVVWFELEEYDSTISDLKKYIFIYDDDAEAYYYRGLSYFYLLNKKAAYKDFVESNQLGYKKADGILRKYFRDYHL